MDSMLDYRLHAAILATEDRVRRLEASRRRREPVRVHLRRPTLRSAGREQ